MPSKPPLASAQNDISSVSRTVVSIILDLGTEELALKKEDWI